MLGASVIALLGNLSRDLFPGGAPRTGGAPFHAARALQHLTRRGAHLRPLRREDRDELLPPVVALGTPVAVRARAPRRRRFAIDLRGRPAARCGWSRVGDTWLPADLPALADEVRWVHVAPLARSDFPAETLAAAARGRRLSLDGQGLVRAGRDSGELELDGDYDPELLRARLGAEAERRGGGGARRPRRAARAARCS